MCLDTGDKEMPEVVTQSSRVKAQQCLLASVPWELREVKEYFQNSKAFLMKL